ncbi:MAG: alkylation response protein AidB-like acyl-CoA dehydrogenase, partial [Gammaproteobacteria bacterium]
MNLNYTEEQIAFRDEVRNFLDDKLPATLKEKVRLRKSLVKADYELWHHILNTQGWLAGSWPKEYGGAAWDAVQRHIFEDEMARAHAPRIVPFGVAMLGPLLQAFGSKEQKDYYL